VEQRRTQRYKLQLPLQVLQVGDEKVNLTVRTRDISSGGVCFLSSTQFELGGRIEYIITLSGSKPPVRIRCLGKVLRSQRSSSEEEFEVAVTMERYSFVRSEDYEAIAASA
jgi:hypothetical protein